MTPAGQPSGDPAGGRLARAARFARGRWKPFALAAGIAALALVAASRDGTGGAVPDFQAITDVNARKAAFIACLAPRAAEANREILATRRRLLAIDEAMAGGSAGEGVRWRDFLEKVAGDYEVPFPGAGVADRALMARLLRRVDAVPVSLVVAQAAIESGWGTSRFARRGNNFFGMQTYDPDSGMVPRAREPGDRFKVAVYADVGEAIRAYVRNLNTDARYHELRVLREALRRAGGPVTGEKLAEGLDHYSTRGAAYVADVRAVIASNGLARLDGE